MINTSAVATSSQVTSAELYFESATVGAKVGIKMEMIATAIRTRKGNIRFTVSALIVSSFILFKKQIHQKPAERYTKNVNWRQTNPFVLFVMFITQVNKNLIINYL